MKKPLTSGMEALFWKNMTSHELDLSPDIGQQVVVTHDGRNGGVIIGFHPSFPSIHCDVSSSSSSSFPASLSSSPPRLIEVWKVLIDNGQLLTPTSRDSSGGRGGRGKLSNHRVVVVDRDTILAWVHAYNTSPLTPPPHNPHHSSSSHPSATPPSTRFPIQATASTFPIVLSQPNLTYMSTPHSSSYPHTPPSTIASLPSLLTDAITSIRRIISSNSHPLLHIGSTPPFVISPPSVASTTSSSSRIQYLNHILENRIPEVEKLLRCQEEALEELRSLIGSRLKSLVRDARVGWPVSEYGDGYGLELALDRLERVADAIE